MDKNTVIGLVIIGVILSVFTIFNQPSEEELKEQQAKKELTEQRKAENKKDAKEATHEDNKAEVKDSASTETEVIDTNTVTPTAEVKSTKPVASEIIRMENEKLIVDFDTKGGQISSVYLKEFETYHDFAKDDGKITPLALF